MQTHDAVVTRPTHVPGPIRVDSAPAAARSAQEAPDPAVHATPDVTLELPWTAGSASLDALATRRAAVGEDQQAAQGDGVQREFAPEEENEEGKKRGAG